MNVVIVIRLECEQKVEMIIDKEKENEGSNMAKRMNDIKYVSKR